MQVFEIGKKIRKRGKETNNSAFKNSDGKKLIRGRIYTPAIIYKNQ